MSKTECIDCLKILQQENILPNVDSHKLTTDHKKLLLSGYKQWIKINHPDKGGNVDKVQLINSCIDTVSKNNRCDHYFKDVEKNIEEDIIKSQKNVNAYLNNLLKEYLEPLKLKKNFNNFKDLFKKETRNLDKMKLLNLPKEIIDEQEKMLLKMKIISKISENDLIFIQQLPAFSIDQQEIIDIIKSTDYDKSTLQNDIRRSKKNLKFLEYLSNKYYLLYPELTELMDVQLRIKEYLDKMNKPDLFKCLKAGRLNKVNVVNKCLNDNNLTFTKLVGSGTNGSAYIACINDCKEEIIVKVGLDYGEDYAEEKIAKIVGDLGYGPKIINTIVCKGVKGCTDVKGDKVNVKLILMEKLDLTLQQYLSKDHDKKEIKQLASDTYDLFMKFAYAGFQHDDMKPDNIMIKYIDGKPKPYLIDFGTTQYKEYEPYKHTGWSRVYPLQFDKNWDLLNLSYFIYTFMNEYPSAETFVYRLSKISDIVKLYSIDSSKSMWTIKPDWAPLGINFPDYNRIQQT